jgi:TolB protein
MPPSFVRRPPSCATVATCVLALAVLTGRPASAQDTTTRGVRIGLAYDATGKPGVIVLPVAGLSGDSVRAIVSRDLDAGDRITVIPLDAVGSRAVGRSGIPNWTLLAQLGAAAAVQLTPTAAGFHLAVYDVATKQTAVIRDYPAPPGSDARRWRAALHGLADDLEESFTGIRGIAATRIVYERARQLWVVDSDGEQAVGASELPSPASPAWAPDGRAIVYSTYIPSQIVLQPLDGRPRIVAGGAGVYISPAVSPDGSAVLYAHGVDDGVDLYTAPAAGGSGRRLSVGRGSDNVSPTFSPDGRRIAFMSGRAGHPEIYTMDADGTNVDLLTPLDLAEGAYRASPAWSPDGRLVAFQSRIAGRFQLMTVALRDRSVRQLTSDGRNEHPSWAPDARHIVFMSDRGGSRQLWIMDVESGRTRQLTHGPSARAPAWSPHLVR